MPEGNEPPELGLHPTRTGRPGLWRSAGVVDWQHPEEAGSGTTVERGRVQQVPGADLGEEVLRRFELTTNRLPDLPAEHPQDKRQERCARNPPIGGYLLQAGNRRYP